MNRAALAVLVAGLGLLACSSDEAGSEVVDRELSVEDRAALEVDNPLPREDDLIGDGGVVTEQTTDDCADDPDSERCELVPSLQPSVSPLSESVVVPEGFSTVLIEITEADGEVCEVCMWLADSADERGQGLMGVTSLGTPEGMAFVWEQPTAGAFFMFQTVTPLSIAWFGDDGALVSTADMDPCLSENSAECERFPAGGQFVLAIEVFQGDLASIGITDGATARLLADTEAVDCPLR